MPVFSFAQNTIVDVSSVIVDVSSVIVDVSSVIVDVSSVIVDVSSVIQQKKYSVPTTNYSMSACRWCSSTKVFKLFCGIVFVSLSSAKPFERRRNACEHLTRIFFSEV